MPTAQELWDAGDPQAPAGFVSWGAFISAFLTSGGTFEGTSPAVRFNETDQTADFRLVATGGNLEVQYSALGNGTDWVALATFSSTGVNLADKLLVRAEVKDYSETVNALGNVSGAVSANFESGNVVTATLTGNVTGLTISNPPASGKAGSMTLILTQDGTGSRTLTLDSAVYKTAGDAAVTLSTTAGARDVLTLLTTNGGTTWDVFVSGKDMR